jgi:hypothetical protein
MPVGSWGNLVRRAPCSSARAAVSGSWSASRLLIRERQRRTALRICRRAQGVKIDGFLAKRSGYARCRFAARGSVLVGACPRVEHRDYSIENHHKMRDDVGIFVDGCQLREPGR